MFLLPGTKIRHCPSTPFTLLFLSDNNLCSHRFWGLLLDKSSSWDDKHRLCVGLESTITRAHAHSGLVGLSPVPLLTGVKEKFPVVRRPAQMWEAMGSQGSPVKSYDYLLKFLLVGDSDVGKGEILDSLQDGSAESPYAYSSGESPQSQLTGTPVRWCPLSSGCLCHGCSSHPAAVYFKQSVLTELCGSHMLAGHIFTSVCALLLFHNNRFSVIS